jgi:hypothetical protein
MRKIIILLFALISITCFSQNVRVIRVPLQNKDTFVTTITTTDKTVSYVTSSVTVDTFTRKYVLPPVVIPPVSTGQTLTNIGGWNAYVHLPSTYNSSTKTYPTIIFFPGLGEVGTNAASVIANGPGAYITQGWNGNVTVDGSTVEFIVISLQPPAAYPTETIVNQRIQTIKSLYRVDSKRLHLTGLSHGGWCSTTFVTGDPLGGPYTYASQIASVVEVQGVIPNDNTPYPDLFDNFVKQGGKFLGFEQRLDNRGMPTRVNRMNTTVPASAIYFQTNFGTGGHCCWEQFYGGKGVQPGVFNMAGVNQNMYQWMARQSLKTVTPAPSAACNTAKPVSYTIAPTQPGEIYITNAINKGWKGGDTLKIPAGTYSVIEIDSFGGDPCRDIVVINDGQVNVTGSMRFQKDVRYVKVIAINKGIKCKNFAFNRVTRFTIDGIEIGPNPDGVGIYGKQDPYINQPWTQYPNYVSRNITITNCYVHDVAGEGMYIGHTAPDGDPYNLEGTKRIIPQRMDSVTISNCIVTNCGWDGIQLSNARNGCKIFGNTVTNFGMLDLDGQRAGIIIGGNTSGDAYNNTVTNGMGNGIQFFGYGRMECYGNTITNVGNTKKNTLGEESIYGQAYPSAVEPTNPKQAMVIHDNQVNYPKPRGVARINDNNNSEPVNFYNNKICLAASQPVLIDWEKALIFFQVGYRFVNNTLWCAN